MFLILLFSAGNSLQHQNTWKSKVRQAATVRSAMKHEACGRIYLKTGIKKAQLRAAKLTEPQDQSLQINHWSLQLETRLSKNYKMPGIEGYTDLEKWHKRRAPARTSLLRIAKITWSSIEDEKSPTVHYSPSYVRVEFRLQSVPKLEECTWRDIDKRMWCWQHDVPMVE